MRGVGESRPFSPLPSTSADQYTIALNDSLFNATESLEPKVEPKDEPEVQPESEETQPDPQLLEVRARTSLMPLLCAVAIETDRLRAETPPSPQPVGVHQVAETSTSILNSTQKIINPYSTMSGEDCDSDCEIVGEDSPPTAMPLPKLDIDPEQDYPASRLRSKNRKRPKRDDPLLGSIVDVDSPTEVQRRSDSLPIDDIVDDSSIFNQAMMYISDLVSMRQTRRRIPRTRIIDTVDLSSDTYKPTPTVSEVIVIDSDASFTAPSTSQRPVNGDVASPGVPRLHDCPICLESFSSSKPIASTYCGHVFCTPCVQVIMSTSKKCPTCRKTLKKKGFHQLFL